MNDKQPLVFAEGYNVKTRILRVVGERTFVCRMSTISSVPTSAFQNGSFYESSMLRIAISDLMKSGH